jgi:molybdopterin converting factor small subunit
MSDAIRVTVRCFSHLRHELGTGEIALDLPAGSTTAEVEARVRERLGPALQRLSFRLAVNQELVDRPTALFAGDEVALLPPMQGG